MGRKSKPYSDRRRFYTARDLPNETVTRSAKEIKCTPKNTIPNDTIYDHEFNQIPYQNGEGHESIIATESSAETSLHHFTMESDIDKTAELLPSGRIQSHHYSIKTAVSETSPTQLISTVNPKASNDLTENRPSLSLTYSQGKHFNQLSRTESTKKLAQSSLELPEGLLDMGKTEPEDDVTIDLYSDGTYRTHLETPDSFENIEQCVNLKRKSNDNDNEDLYTNSNSNLCEGNISFTRIHTLAQKNELCREIQSKMELTDDILFRNKVWNVPNPAEIHRNVAGMKLQSGNIYLMGSVEKGDYIKTGDRETDEETLMLKSKDHGNQTNAPLGQHVTTYQKFLNVHTLHESNMTDHIELKSFMKVLQDSKTKDDNHITVQHNAYLADQTQKMVDHVCKEVNQCGGEEANDKRRKDEVYFTTVNDKNDQTLETDSNKIKLFDKNTSSKETFDNISGITSMYPLSIKKGLPSPVAFLSLEDRSNENMDNPPQSSSKTLSYDEETQPSTQLNIPTCASLEDKSLSLKDTENQPQICSNNVVMDSIENHVDNKSAINVKNCKARNDVSNQPEFQRNRDISTRCPENVDTRPSTPILKELSSSQSNDINAISPGHDFISTGSGTVNGGITMDNSSESFKNDCNDAGIKILVDGHHAKQPSEGHQVPYCEVINQQDQVSSNTVNINKHYRKDDNNIIEVTKKPCHSHNKNSETANQKELPGKEDTSGSVLQTKSNRDNNPLDSSHQCKTTVQESSFKSRITCLDPYDQLTTSSSTSTYQGTNNSSDSFTLCTKIFSDPSDHCRTTMSDSSYQGKLNSLCASDQCSTMNPDSAFKCSDTFLNPSDQLITPCPDSTNEYKDNLSDLSYFTSTSSDPLKNCNTTSPDLSNQCTLSTLDSTYQWKNDTSEISYSSDSSALCTMASSDSADHCKTITPESSDQVKINSLDTSDQYTTMNPDSTLQCSVISLNSSDQCKTSCADLSNQCKNNSSDLSHQCTVTSSNLSNQYPTIAPDLSYQLTSEDPSNKDTTISSDSTYHWTDNSSNSSKQCGINDSVSSTQCTTTAPDSSDQYRTTSLDPLGQCTTITSDAISQLKKNSPDSSYKCTMTSSDRSDHCTTTARNLYDEHRTISVDSSNHILSLPNLNYQLTGSQTPSHHSIIISSDLSDLHTNDASHPSGQTPLPEADLNNQCVTNAQNPTLLCRINSADLLPLSNTLYSDQSLNVSDSCTTVSSDLIYEFKATSLNHSSYEDTTTSHGFSYQCTTDFSSGINQSTNTSPNEHDQHDSSVDPSSQRTTCTTSSGHQCSTSPDTSFHCITYSDPHSHTMSSYDTPSPCTATSPSSPQQSSTSPPDLCTSTTNFDLPDKSTVIFGDPDLPCTTISLLPSYQHATTSTESSDHCTDMSADFQLHLQCENNIDCEPLKKPTLDEYGCIIKQRECSFLEEMRRIYLDDPGIGFSLLDSGIILTKRVYYVKNIALMTLRDGEELGTVIQRSKLFLTYKLEKHFYVIQQLNEDWCYTEDRITKVTMLMKKVPLTSNWLKTLRNFLCLPNDYSLLIPYAVVTDRNGFILFLMENREVLGVGTPPLGYMLNTMENLSKVLSFMRYCRIHRVLPRKIATSILYTPQGICFDPSSLCNNDDLCEYNKCLKECLLVFLFNGQQEEFNGTIELILERAQLLLEEDWPPQICLARLFSTQGALPFSLPSFSDEN